MLHINGLLGFQREAPWIIFEKDLERGQAYPPG